MKFCLFPDKWKIGKLKAMKIDLENLGLVSLIPGMAKSVQLSPDNLTRISQKSDRLYEVLEERLKKKCPTPALQKLTDFI